MIPNIFCPHCGRYIGLRRACAFCEYTRPAGELLPSPDGLLWETQAGEGRVMGLARAGAVLAVALRAERSLGGPYAEVERAGSLALLDAATGHPLHTISLPAAPADPPTALDDSLVLRLEEGLFLALNQATGEERWRLQREMFQGRGSPLLTPQALYLGTANGHLHALDPASGSPLWPHPFAARKAITATPLLHRKRLFFGDRAGALYACDPRTGRPIWPEPVQVGRRMEAPPVAAGDFVLAVASRPGGGVACGVDAVTGTVRWRAELPGEVRAAPLVVGDAVHVVTRQGTWVVLGLGDGRERGRRDLRARVVATPVRAGGAIIFGLGDGRILLTDADSGAEVACLEAAGRVRATPLVWEGTVFVGGDSGKVRAFPWHLGRWAWAAEWCEQQGREADAATCRALAGDGTNDLDERRRHHEEALRLWREHDPLRAARFCEGLVGQPPERVAEESEQAAHRLAPREPWQAAGLLLRAADLYADTGRTPEVTRCNDAAARLKPVPYVVVRPLSLPHFEAGEPGMVVLVVRNRGHGAAQGARVRLGGVLADSLAFVFERLEPRQEVELRARVTPTGPGDLQVEVRYQDERGRAGYAPPLALPLHVTPSDRPILTKGDVGALVVRYKRGTPPPRVKLEGEAGMIRYEEMD